MLKRQFNVLNLITVLTTVLFITSCSGSQSSTGDEFSISLKKVPYSAVFSSDTMSIWGGSMLKDEGGTFHLFYSRWPKKLGWAWVTDSEIAHAVSDSPYGPFKYADVALPRRGKQFWDGWCTHNPTVHKFGNKYYLYYMGNTGDGKVVTSGLNWTHRNLQRIGVAVADNLNGPWRRLDKPIVDVSKDTTALDALMTSNPSICEMKDGKYLMIYKGVGLKKKLPFGGPVTHCAAISNTPTGPFIKQKESVFNLKGEFFPAEDPYIWLQGEKYHAIVKRMYKKASEQVFELVQFESEDGLSWSESPKHEISSPEITFEDDTYLKLAHLERPQLYFENGIPTILLCAADTLNAKHERITFNLQIPINLTKQ